jgi:hypothetical protein
MFQVQCKINFISLVGVDQLNFNRIGLQALQHCIKFFTQVREGDLASRFCESNG